MAPSASLPGPLRELLQAGAELRGLPEQTRRARPGRRPPGLAIDIGAGHAPFADADVIVDKYVDDDFERSGALALSKPLVVADGEALPFADDAVAFVYAAHVLEHAVDPVAFAAELSRVGRAGFVQTPSRMAEQAFGWPFHPWLIDRDGDTLVFEPKVVTGDPMTRLHDLHRDSALFRLCFFAHRSAFHHTVKWRDRVDVRVAGTSRAHQSADFDLERTLAALAHRTVPPLPPAVRAALRCPVCHGALAGDRTLTCAGCGRDYPVVGTVPVLVAAA